MKKPIQYFKEEDLKRNKKLSPTQISQFLEEFRQMQQEEVRENKLISMRIDNLLLNAFKEKCEKTDA